MIAVLFCAATLAGGAAFLGKRVFLTVTTGGETALEKNYRLSFAAVAKVVFRHGGDFEKYCENEFSGNAKECVGSLNSEITADIYALEDEFFIPVREAEATFSDGSFVYTEGSAGRALDGERLCREILKSMGGEIRAEGAFIVTEPETTESILRSRTKKLAEFYTGFATSGENRRHNIALAASKLNNLKVEAGAKLSFNETVGARTAENGFAEANIIRDGVFTPGVGGGVCQVSTTLFNVWLKAGLGFESAAAHSLPVGYVKPSLDAMVSSATDLVLKNDSPSAVYIYARCKQDRLYVTLYGEPCGYEVTLRSATVRVVEAEYRQEYGELDWAEGETERVVKRAVDGLISESYRDFFKAGELVNTEKLRRNAYKPQAGLKILRKENNEAA